MQYHLGAAPEQQKLEREWGQIPFNVHDNREQNVNINNPLNSFINFLIETRNLIYPYNISCLSEQL